MQALAHLSDIKYEKLDGSAPIILTCLDLIQIYTDIDTINLKI